MALTQNSFHDIKVVSLKGGLGLDYHDRYRKQPDPTDPSVKLAWLFKRNGALVGDTPRQQDGVYKQHEIAGTGEKWMIHCSFAGMLDFLFRTLGEDNISISDDGKRLRIVVKLGMKGSWIGRGGCVAGFIKEMMEVDKVYIVEDPNWKKVRR